MGVWICQTLVVLLASVALACSATAGARVRGLDHIPVAVSDLDGSQADFKALGFAVKPGRPHANGLRNAHVKFADGTEIELITAPAATDALASNYHSWLKSGDGPAFLGFYAPELGSLIEHLSQRRVVLERKGDLATVTSPTTLQRLFFARRQRSPTDRPEHFAHANTAVRLAGVWLAGAVEEQRLLSLLGATPAEAQPCGPLGRPLAALSLPEADIAFLPVSARSVPGRSIVGVTVTVESLETARRVLSANRIRFQEPTGCARVSLWVEATDAHGLWLELHQPPASR